MKRILVTTAALILLHGSSFAAPAATAPTPDVASNPVLAAIQKLGAKFYYLGNRSGLEGWFIVKDGQVQIAYATPDNKGALVGALFAENGDNVTAVQVSNLVQNNKEVADLIAAAQKEQMAISSVGTPPPAAPNAMIGASGPAPSVALSPGERLMHDLSGATTVVVGNSSTPEILMVMDPRCPHCQATWKLLRENVIKGAVHVRMIPIATPGTDNERAAGMLLAASDPLNTWDKYVAGDKEQLDGTPSDVVVAALHSNHALIDSWKITETPTMVYRAKDGKVKIVQSEPAKISTVFGDLGL
jgi:protein-disulfide isomerase